jgi:hypothetical protein
MAQIGQAEDEKPKSGQQRGRQGARPTRYRRRCHTWFGLETMNNFNQSQVAGILIYLLKNRCSQ